MDFRWNDWNTEHVQEHGVSPVEAEEVVLHARRPYPVTYGEGKRAVWGIGQGGRLLQVVFVVEEDGSHLHHSCEAVDGQ
jgi:uncharacterized DUF497 family protein